MSSLKLGSAADRLVRIAGSNSTGDMDVCLSVVSAVCYQTGLDDGPITHTNESYRLWCVVVCDPQT